MKAGMRLGPFIVEGPLGAGGMGQVWRARHGLDGLPVAIKVVSGARTARARALLRAEGRAVARIDHPSVIRLLDMGDLPEETVAVVDLSQTQPMAPIAPRPPVDDAASAPTALAEDIVADDVTPFAPTAASAPAEVEIADDDAGAPYLVMELADGSLKDVLPLAPTEAIEALRAVLSGLAAAHARDIVHRDIKPANVLRVGGRWVVADFGVAAARGGVSGTVAGTPAYMAPEQRLGDARAQGPWTDLFAVGCLAHQLITGHPPFGPVGLTPDAAPAPLLDAPGLPPHFGAWVDRLLARDPAGRHPSAAAALAALDGGTVEFIDPWPKSPRDLPFDLVGAGLGLYAHRPVPLVGREPAQKTLWRALGRVHRTGDMGLTIVLGEPGTGKSRVARWLVEQAVESGLARAVYSAPGRTLGDALRRAMNLGEAPDEATARTLVAERLAGAEPTADEIRAIARLATDGFPNDARIRAGVMAEWLGLRTLDGPVVWWIDDAHRCPDALAAVERIMAFDDGAGVPVLVVMTAVEEEGPGADVPTIAAVTEISTPASRRTLLSLMMRRQTIALPLEPLERDATRRLVRDALYLDGAMADALEQRSGGHPGFIVRWVAEQIARGALAPGRHGFVPADGSTAILPLDPTAGWRWRAAGLPRDAEERDLLELAAAMGPVVDDAAWSAAGGPRAGALRDRLMEEAVLRPLGGGRWRFMHGPMAEAIAAGAVTSGRWAAVAGRAADAMAASGRAEPSRLADVYLAAERPEGAIDPLLEAADTALNSGRYATALTYLDQRRGLLLGLGRIDPDARRAARLRLGALRRLARPAEAVELAEELWKDPPDDIVQRIEALREWTEALRALGRYDEAIERGTLGLEDARRSGARAARVSAAVLLARQYIFTGRFDEAEPLVEEARAAMQTDREVASVEFAAGLRAIQLSDRATARRCFEIALAAFTRIGRLHGAADCVGQLAELARAEGDLDGAWALNARGLRMARLAGASTAGLLVNHGFLALERGDAHEARRLFRRSAGALTRDGNTMALPYARLGRLHAAALLADGAEWRAALAMSADLASRVWPEMPDMLLEAAHAAEATGFDASVLHDARRRLLA